MPTNKLLQAIGDVFDAKKKKQRKQKSNLKIILAKLKKQSKALEKKLKDESDSKKRKQLQRELNTICAQRRKGIKLLKSL